VITTAAALLALAAAPVGAADEPSAGRLGKAGVLRRSDLPRGFTRHRRDAADDALTGVAECSAIDPTPTRASVDRRKSAAYVADVPAVDLSGTESSAEMRAVDTVFVYESPDAAAMALTGFDPLSCARAVAPATLERAGLLLTPTREGGTDNPLVLDLAADVDADAVLQASSYFTGYPPGVDPATLTATSPEVKSFSARFVAVRVGRAVVVVEVSSAGGLLADREVERTVQRVTRRVAHAS